METRISNQTSRSKFLYPPQPQPRYTKLKNGTQTNCKPSSASLIHRDRHPPSIKAGNIILLGVSGSGKSTALNEVFGNISAIDVNKIENGKGTQNILEYNCTSSKNLRIIDTPGLGSLYCLQWDARIIASLKHYLDKFNPELRHSIPHVVIITVKFNDPSLDSIQGNSNFSRCLEAISTLNRRLFSNEYCNLVILLTSFMSGKKIDRDNPSVKIQIVREIVRKFLGRTCHIVLGENDGENWGLPKTNFGYYKLPVMSTFGDIYPGNLIDLIYEIMGRADGSIPTVSGAEVFNREFLLDKNRRKICLTGCLEMLSPQSKRYQKAYEAVQWAYGNVTIAL